MPYFLCLKKAHKVFDPDLRTVWFIPYLLKLCSVFSACSKTNCLKSEPFFEGSALKFTDRQLFDLLEHRIPRNSLVV